MDEVEVEQLLLQVPAAPGGSSGVSGASSRAAGGTHRAKSATHIYPNKTGYRVIIGSLYLGAFQEINDAEKRLARVIWCCSYCCSSCQCVSAT